MHPFNNVLRSVAARLELPQPIRSRILLELAADLESFYAELRARGVSESEARGRAAAALVPAPEALEDLLLLHRPLYQRLLDHFSESGRHRLERALLVVLTAAPVVALGLTLASGSALRDPTPWLWPVVSFAVLGVAFAVAKLFQLYVKRDHSPERLRSGLASLPAIGAAMLVVAFAGAVLDGYGLAGAIAAEPTRQLELLLAWLRRDIALLAVALLSASLLGLAWLAAQLRVARIEHAEAETLLAS